MLNWFYKLFNRDAKPRMVMQLHLLSCRIHGSHYCQCLELVKSHQIQKGDPLILVREPRNIYDQYAIEIFNANKVKLGYVPKNHNRVIAELMDQRCHVYGIVDRVISTDWEPVSISIALDLQSHS